MRPPLHPLLPLLNRLTPGWLTGVPSGARLRHDIATLLARGTPSGEAPGRTPSAGADARSPASPGGWALELGRAPSSEALPQLLERLALELPDGAELAFAAHVHPVDAGVQARAASCARTEDACDAGGTSGCARLLEAAHSRASAHATYLFVRTDAPLPETAVPRALEVFRALGWWARTAPQAGLRALLQAWAPAVERSPGRAVRAWVARPVARARHAAQWQFPQPEALESSSRLSCLQLRLRLEPGTGRAHFEGALIELLETPRAEQDVAAEALEQALRASSLAAQGVSPHEGLAAALPWLTPSQRLWRLPAMRHPVPMSLARAAALMPFDAGLSLPERREDAPSARGALQVRNARGESVLLDARGPGRSSHVLIQGAAGAGNTYFAHAMLASHLAAGGHAWAVRWAREPLFDALHGLLEHPLDEGAPLSLNPLGGYQSLDALQDDMGLLLGWLLALAGLELRPLENGCGDEAARHLEEALHRAWQRQGERLDVEAVQHALDASGHDTAHALAERLRTRLAGLDARWLAGRSPLLDERGSCAFDAQALSGSVWGELLCTTLLVLHARVAFEHDRRTSKMLVLDELALIGSTGATRLLEELLRRARPYGVQWVCVTGTFSAEPARQRPHERVLDAHSAFKLLLSGRLEDQRGWARRVASEAHEELLLRQVRTHAGRRARALWVDEERGGVELLTLELAPLAHPVFGHDREVLLAWKKARREGLEP